MIKPFEAFAVCRFFCGKLLERRPPRLLRWRKNTVCQVNSNSIAMAVSTKSYRVLNFLYGRLDCASIIVAMHLQYSTISMLLFFQDILLLGLLEWEVYLFWTVFNINFEDCVSCIASSFQSPDLRLHTWATVLGGVSAPFGSRLVLPFTSCIEACRCSGLIFVAKRTGLLGRCG